MANDIPQYEPESGDEGQLDEFGFPIPTQEDMEAEYLRTHQTMALADQMRREEAQLPTDIGPAPMLTQITPSAPPLMLPVSRGRMYMGPALSAAQEREFLQSAPGTSRNLVAPPVMTPEQQAAAVSSVAAMTRPTDPYMTASDPVLRQFSANERIRQAVAGGMSFPQAFQLYGMDALGQGVKPMSPYQMESTQLRAKELAQREAAAKANLELRRQALGQNFETITEKIPATEAVPATPGQPAKKGIFGIGSRAAVPATPAVPATGEKTISRRVRVSSPDASTAKSETAATATAGTPMRIKTRAQYDALPPGAVYIGTDGKLKQKPAALQPQ